MRSGVRFALDLGAARVGVAKSDASGFLASPFAVWQADAWLNLLREVVNEWQPIEILVGLPVSLQGDEKLAAENIRELLPEIMLAAGEVPLRLVDERLTTAAARKLLQAAGYDSRADRLLIDAAAATVLLEDALEAERRQGIPPGEVWQ